MYQKVREYIRRYKMLEQGDKIIAGVSGGADSICLLFMLIGLAKEIGCSVTAVHVHHGLRGAAADADAAYVERVCREQGIGCRIFREDVGAFAERNRLTVEEAGRDVRRACFLRVMEEEQGTKVALAHHQNDNAETLIWNLCRGCGIKGLGGIAPVAGAFIRPLLCLRRDEIESYLKERGIAYCVDETNLEDAYTRNRIRRHVIPYLEENVNRQSVEHMSETMEQIRKIGSYLEQEVLRYQKECVSFREDGAAVLEKEAFRKVPEAVRAFLLHELLCRAARRRKDIEAVHVKMLEALLEKQVGRQIRLPYGVRAVRCYEGIELITVSGEEYERGRRGHKEDRREYEEGRRGHKEGRRVPQESGETDKASVICISGSCGSAELPWMDGSVRKLKWRVLERESDEKEEMIIFPKNPYTKWFDYDIIKNTVKMRYREPGDYITISKNGGTQKLKQYFINEKVPGRQRDKIWLAADGRHIMWIVGYRQNQMYQITDKTRRILEIEINGGEDDGGEYQGIGSGGRGCEAD